MISSRQRAYLKKISAGEDAIFQIGKSGLTPEITAAIDEALDAREIVKINVLKNCADVPKDVADTVSARTRSDVVSVVGRKIVVYRPAKDEKKRRIILP